MVKAEIKGGNLVVTIPLEENPQPSKSTGATLIVASTHGGVVVPVEHPKYKGEQIRLSVNGYITNPNYVKPAK